MSDTKGQIILNLARGVPPVQIARFLGITESYVSQIAADPEVKEQIRQAASAETDKIEKYDSSVDEAEETALSNIKRKLPLANLQQSLMAYKVLNAAKRRKDSRTINTGQIDAPLVQIILPSSAPQVQYLTNSRSEIVEVEGKTMVAIHPDKLKELALQKLGREVTPPEGDAIKAARASEMLQTISAPKQLTKPKKISELDITDIL